MNVCGSNKTEWRFLFLILFCFNLKRKVLLMVYLLFTYKESILPDFHAYNPYLRGSILYCTKNG